MTNVGRLTDRLLADMSPRHHLTSELSTIDFAAFDDLLLGENPERGRRHLYLLDHLLTILHGRGAKDNRSEFHLPVKLVPVPV